MWLLHEHFRGVVGVHECLLLEAAAPGVVVHATVLHESFHVVVVAADLLDALVQGPHESVDPALVEPELEVAEPRQQVLVGRSAALEVGAPEEGELDVFLEEGGDGDVERLEVGGWLPADEDDAMSCQECLSQ